MSVNNTYKKIAQVLKKFRIEIKREQKISESSIEEFKQIALILEKSLPKLSDPTLLEIDDILYQDDNVDGARTNGIDTGEPNIVIDPQCILLYIEAYTFLINSSQAKINQVLETTFLRLLEHSPDEVYNDRIGVLHILLCIEGLMMLKNVNKLCLSLKALKIALNKNKKVVREMMQEDVLCNCFFLWMLRLQNIPEARHPQQKRISSWLRHQSTILIKTIDFKTFKFHYDVQIYLDIFTSKLDDNFVLVEKEIDIDILNILRTVHQGFGMLPFICDIFHSYFMSANDEEEKIKRLKDFLGLAFFNLQEIQNNPVKYLAKRVVDQCRYIAAASIYRTFVTFCELHRPYSDDTLRFMENKYGCEVKPYLSGDKNKAYFVVEESKLQPKRETSNLNQNSEDEPDYTIEKFIFYDDFVKKLQVLNIVHTAFMMFQELLQVEVDLVGLDSQAFRQNYLSFRTYLNEQLLNPSQRGHIPWLIKIVLTKCPFMILPKRHEHLVNDLIKMLRGEEIDELVEEELYFLINNVEVTECQQEEDEDMFDD